LVPDFSQKPQTSPAAAKASGKPLPGTPPPETSLPMYAKQSANVFDFETSQSQETPKVKEKPGPLTSPLKIASSRAKQEEVPPTKKKIGEERADSFLGSTEKTSPPVVRTYQKKQRGIARDPPSPSLVFASCSFLNLQQEQTNKSILADRDNNPETSR